MNNSTRLVVTGIAAIAGSVLTIAPLSVAALAPAPTLECLEDESLGQCKVHHNSDTRSGGGTGSRVRVQELPTVHIDAKDHPNYGQITPEVRVDAKDHPNYGQVTPEVRIDAKDHPNYGPVTPDGGQDVPGNVERSSGRLNTYAV
jgi:hypothetical protein